MLLEPFCRQPYIMNEDKIKTKTESEHRSISHACRSGWVLFTGGREVRSRTESVISYYLYNPITGKVRELPDLTLLTYPTDLVRSNLYRLRRHFRATVFRPRSNSCQHIHSRDEESSWKTHTFTCPDAENYRVEGVVYLEGEGRESFYCFSEKGLLSSFNLAGQEWEWKPLTTRTCPRLDWFIYN